MIQVMDRAFKILEKVADNPLRIWTISEMAELINVQSATCFHIVNSLVELGYLERLGMRKGYRMGPAVNRLCHSPAYRPDLVEAADHLLREYSEIHKEPVLLCVLHGYKRYILCEAGATGSQQVNYNLTVIEDIYRTTTGRILLAWQSEQQVSDIIKNIGLPPACHWAEATTREDLDRELEKIRNQGGLLGLNNPYLAQIGFPIFDAEHNLVAAIGSYIPKYRFIDEHKEKTLSAMLEMAAKISTQLGNREALSLNTG